MQVTGITHHRVHANGINLHYVSAGDGPAVVLLHGFPECWFAWRKQIPVLAQRHRVIAPDLRGYGDSDRPATGYDKRTMANDIRELLRALGVPRAAVVGHDRGARVAARLAKDHPDAVARLAILDTVPLLAIAGAMDMDLAPHYWHWFLFQAPDLPEALLAGREEMLVRYLLRAWSYNPDTLSEEEVAVYLRAYAQPGGLRGALADYRATPQDLAQDQADAVTPITCPIHALWGANSSRTTAAPDMLASWRRMGPEVSGSALNECGHMPHEEQPEMVNERLLAILNDV